ncbi:MAG: T9SS type A sorting domain-containing protein [Bacteroidota bacterium]
MQRLTYSFAILFFFLIFSLNLFGTTVSFEGNHYCSFAHEMDVKSTHLPPPVLITGCGESFFDPGGANGDFQPLQSQITTICPDNPDDFVNIRFTEWDLGPCCGATLELHEGSTVGIPIQVFDGSFRPTLVTGFVPGCITLNFNATINAIPAPGWEGEIICSPCPPPTEHFIEMLTETTVQLFVFTPFIEMLYIEVGLSGFTPNSGQELFSKNQFDEFIFLEGLEPGTTYDIYVSNICGGADTSAVYGPISFSTVPSCGGTFYDPAGPDGDILLNTFIGGAICSPTPGGFVQLDFSSFDLGTCCSRLELYDGTSTGDPLIGAYEGTNSPGVVAATQSSGCITFFLNAFGNDAGPGWEAAVSCIDCPPPNNPTLLSTSSTNANIIWDFNPTADEYYFEVGIHGFTPGTGSYIVAAEQTETTVLVTGLEANTAYEFVVRSACSQSDTSEFSAPLAFLTSPSCDDYFYDSGGANGNYGSFESVLSSICPDVPDKYIELEFDAFSIVENGSFLEIYDSENGFNNFLGAWTGEEGPGRISASNPSGCLTLVFNSDFFVGQGWAAQVNCIDCPVPQNVEFGTSSVNSYIFTWTGIDTANAYQWEVLLPGMTPGTGNAILTGNTTLPVLINDLNGLSGNTDYEFYVRSDCGANGFSPFSNPLPFTAFPSCGDDFYDPGGPDEPYEPGDAIQWSICPEEPFTFAQVEFIEFDLPNCCAFLSYDDGFQFGFVTDILGLPGPVTSVHPDGCLNFVLNHVSDNAIGQGWKAVVNCVSCPPNETVQFDQITDSSVKVNWSAFVVHSEATWEIGTKGYQPGNGFASGTEPYPNSQIDITGLQPGTEYDLYLQNRCDNNDSLSLSGPFTFRSAPTCGGKFYDPAGPDSNSVVENSTVNTVICPDQPDQFVEVSFTEIDLPVSNNVQSQLRILNGPNSFLSPVLADLRGQLPPMTFNSTDESGCLAFALTVLFTQSFPGWEADVSCTGCPKIKAEFLESTKESAELQWESIHTADEYYWEIGPLGFVPGTAAALRNGTNTGSLDTTIVLNDLASGTFYDFYVRSNCSGENSPFSEPIRFSTIPSCDDFFYDPGGPNDPYENDTFYSTTICPDHSDQKITVTFNLLNTQECCDRLEILNGPFSNSPFITSVGGNIPPPPFTSTHSTGCLTFNFFSDGSVLGNGWEALISCTPPNSVTDTDRFDQKLTLFPNPSDDQVFASFRSPVAETVTIRVYDIIGHLILEKDHACVVGENIVEVTLNDDAAGTYLVAVTGSHGTTGKRLVKY